jgi:hypothetical protein
MMYSLPVMADARSDARNAMSSATSSGRAGRPSGIPPSELINPARAVVVSMPASAGFHRERAALLTPGWASSFGSPNDHLSPLSLTSTFEGTVHPRWEVRSATMHIYNDPNHSELI